MGKWFRGRWTGVTRPPMLTRAVAVAFVSVHAGCDGIPWLHGVTAFKGWNNIAYVNLDRAASDLDELLPSDFNGWSFDFSEPVDGATLAEAVSWLGPDGVAVPLSIGIRSSTEVWATTPEIPVGPGQQLIFDGDVRDWAGKSVEGSAFTVTFEVVPETCAVLPDCLW